MKEYRFSITILGSSSALPTSKRFSTAQVLNHHERFFLLDCGEGTQIQLRRFKIRFSRIHHIFISHLHGDHIYGLPGLISTFALLGRKVPLHIYAHKELKEMIDLQFKYAKEKLPFSIEFHALQNKEIAIIYEDSSLRIKSIPLQHSVSCCGFIFEEKQRLHNVRKEAIAKYKFGVKDIIELKHGGDFIKPDGTVLLNRELCFTAPSPRRYAFCTDTAKLSSIVPHIESVDLLYHEATFMEAENKEALATMHSTARQAGELALEAKVGKLLIGHFSSRYKTTGPLLNEARQVFQNTIAVEDGDVFDIDESCKI